VHRHGPALLPPMLRCPAPPASSVSPRGDDWQCRTGRSPRAPSNLRGQPQRSRPGPSAWRFERTAFRARGVWSAQHFEYRAFAAQGVSSTDHLRHAACLPVGGPPPSASSLNKAVVTTLAHGNSRACLCQPLNAFISGEGKAENGGKTENGVTTDSGGTADGGAQPTAEGHGRSAVARVPWQNFCGRSLGHRLGSEIQKPVSSKAGRKWAGQSLRAPPSQMVSHRWPPEDDLPKDEGIKVRQRH
jgi:hypothetical protein